MFQWRHVGDSEKYPRKYFAVDISNLDLVATCNKNLRTFDMVRLASNLALSHLGLLLYRNFRDLSVG